jgi:hypothetical protein
MISSLALFVFAGIGKGTDHLLSASKAGKNYSKEPTSLRLGDDVDN